MRQPVSSTFHGRDVFAPAAAHLTLGVDVDSFGERVDSMLALPLVEGGEEGRWQSCGSGDPRRPLRQPGHQHSRGRTSAERRDGGDRGRRCVHGLASTYGDGEDLIALIDSSGYLEVAMPMGNAAALLGAGLDTPVTVKPVVVKMKRPL